MKYEEVQICKDKANLNLKDNNNNSNCKQYESLDSETTNTQEICIIDNNEFPKENSPLIKLNSDSRPFLRIKVGNNLSNNNLPSDIQIDFLMDSGGACSLLHLGDYDKLELPQTAVNRNENHQLVADNGTKLDISHRVYSNLTIGGKSILHPFYVCNGIKHNIALLAGTLRKSITLYLLTENSL